MTLPLALTLGEPAGIGPDITLLAWLRRRDLALPPFYVLGDPDDLTRRARLLGLDVPVSACTPQDAMSVFAQALPVVPLAEKVTAEAGRPNESSAPAAIASIRRAVADVFSGRAHAVVTNPVAKAVLYRTGFAEPGHTEFLAKLAQEHTGRAVHPVMMLWSPELAVVPVTIHLPVRDVPRVLTTELIVETGRIVARDLRERFGIARPRLALAGLNPHAGEDGALGTEDGEIVAPAVLALRRDGIDARGP
jgi:4-hydroxythreonine-4-phosphate dehydrogenase